MNDTSKQLVATADSIDLPIRELTSLLDAIDRSVDAIDRARGLLADDRYLKERKLDFIGFGSLARYEMTPSSDLDYLLVGDINEDEDALKRVVTSSVVKLRQGMVDNVVLSEPGKTNIFGGVVQSSEITSTIGLLPDTNHTLTRRILLLEESVSLFNPESHQALLRSILGEYLASRKPGSSKVPRVLLNDIIRYWRTIAVDYHAKSSPEQPYSLRYLKLLIPRKLCFVSSIAPLYFMSFHGNGSDEADFLLEHFSQPAMIRLVRLLAKIGGSEYSDADEMRESAARIFQTLNQFIACSGDASWRDRVEQECKGRDPRSETHFGDMRELGRQLHSDIGKIFTSEAMLPFTKEYMIS